MTQQSNEVKRSEGNEGAPGAVTVLLTARVRPEKRAEFLLSARSFGPEGGFEFYEGVEDPERMCAIGRLQPHTEVSPYLESDRFRALKGALRTLTSGWEVSLLSARVSWCADSRHPQGVAPQHDDRRREP